MDENNSIRQRRFFTPGALVLMAVMAVGYLFALARLITGLGSITNLTDQYPWGIWIAIDVATGVALAAGGFTTAALVNIFGRKKYHALERPALLTAWLGYTFVGVGLIFDLGRYYNIWHPAIYWQGNSVLFEVGMCVMFYLLVLTVEFSPTLLTGLLKLVGTGGAVARVADRMERPLRSIRWIVRRVLPLFIVAGVVLSFMHQSSLGSLMLIAPSKLSSLWWTPILPILFLMSAIMVGFPIVIFESIISAKSFGRKPEMELLTPLSRFIPWFLGAYGVLKLGDLFYRNALEDFYRYPSDTVALLVEVGVGVVMPFVMLLQRSVRRSPLWLFIAVTSIIAGVVLNRINVFIVGFHPPFGEVGYFPSIGEISVTLGLVATIMFLYRFFAFYFPMSEEQDALEAPQHERARRRAPLKALIARAMAVVMLLSFVLIYALVHSYGIEESVAVTLAQQYRESAPAIAADSDPMGIEEITSFSPETMPGLIVINHQQTNEKVNDYEPVRFMHKAHASRLDGNCSDCHHRVKDDPTDRIGTVMEFTNLSGHRPSSCVSCHKYANEPDHPTRPGLQGAFHQQCIGCHEKTPSKEAPTDCSGCHHRRVPDHTPFILFSGDPEPQEVTARCLECHEQQGRDILKTAHWNWEGASPNTKGYEHRVDLGKKNVVNNYCIHVRSNEARCSQCHIGYGWKDSDFDFDDPENIDCLVCHDTTGTYAKNAPDGGMPKEEVNIVQVAQNVGRPSRATCGKCHFYGGGGANVKHGDLEPTLVDPPDDFDVHMGKHDMLCQDCHETKEHRIKGQCLAIPASEGRVTCEQCHGDTPHNMNQVTGYHLDQHAVTVACQTCHIPNFAKKTPTKVFWDWSKAGLDLKEGKDQYGMPTFNKKKGAFTWDMNVDPCVTWYNGRHTRHLLEDKVEDPDVPTLLNAPVGSRGDPDSRLYPFKCYSAIIPMDAQNQIFAVPNLWKGFWKEFDWKKALEKGMELYDLPFSGEVGFGKADMFWAINHEVVPATQALHCADCHRKEAVTCTRCHGKEPGVDPSTLIGPLYPESRARLMRSDFQQMGYDGDPASVGRRFRIHPPHGQPIENR